MSFKLAWASCNLREFHNVAGKGIAESGAKALYFIGDGVYTSHGRTCWGTTTSKVTTASTVADFDAIHDQMFNNPGMKLISAAMPIYYQSDDHEWGGNDWDHTIGAANADTNSSIGAVTQADVDAHWWTGVQSMLKYQANNPVNTDSEAVAEKPSNADPATPASQYPVRYFRHGYDINGNIVTANPFVEVFVIDCISYRDPVADVDGGTPSAPTKTMLGVNQRTWLKNRVTASTATFKIIMSPKKSFASATSDNVDGFSAYSMEMQNILNHWDANNVTGLIWCAGDRHTAAIEVKEKPTDSWDHLCVVACPFGQDPRPAPTPDNQTRFANERDRVYGMLEIHKNYVEASIVRIYDHSVIWRGRINSGSNKLTYPKTRVG